MTFDKNEFYARTMHTPDSPERAEMRAALRELSKALIPLHRHLIESAKSNYVFAIGPVESPGHLLRLINDDPFFAWLKPLTAIIVEIDEMTRRDFEVGDAFAIGARLQQFLGHDEYVAALQQEISVAMAHAELRKIMGRVTPSS